MNKKGTHVDWAISMGIFLVYLIGLFILLRPGVTPIHKPERLLGILETKFVQNVTYEVREIPLIVKKCIGAAQGAETVYNIIRVEDEKEYFEFSKWEDFDREQLENKELKCGVTEDNKHPPVGLPGETFYLTYYQKFANEKTNELIIECSPFNLGDEDHCVAHLGASTTKTGIKNEWLEKLKTINYEDLKKNWDFPEDKDFSIYVSISEADLGKESSKINGAEEPQGINLFIKEFKTQSVDKYGSITIPIIVNLRVW